jgi:hypothetical protein
MTFNIARMAHGAAPTSSAADPVLSRVLYGLVAVAGLLAIFAVWALARVVRPRRVSASRARITVATAGWVVGCAILAILVVTALPAAMGGDVGQAMLWTPDIGWAIITIVTLASTVAVARILAAIRTVLATRP